MVIVLRPQPSFRGGVVGLITSREISHPELEGIDLSNRQHEVCRLVEEYYAVAHEWPSAGWIARRLRIHRSTAYEHLAIVREKLGITRRG